MAVMLGFNAQNKTARVAQLVFAAEIVAVALIIGSKGLLNGLGEGAILFILPLMAAYGFVLGAVCGLPVMAVVTIKTGSGTTLDRVIVSIAGIINIPVAVWLIYQIAIVFIKASQVHT